MLRGKRREVIENFKADAEKFKDSYLIAVSVGRETNHVSLNATSSVIGLVCAAAGILTMAAKDCSFEQKRCIEAALEALGVEGQQAN